MENIINGLQKKIEKLEAKQQNAMNVIRSISDINEERQYYELLVRHTQHINVCDNEIERLQHKKKIYEKLLNEYNNYGQNIIPDNLQLESESLTSDDE